MNIHHYRLPDCHQAKGLVIVIDVIRAFTTAAYAFSRGAQEIVFVKTPEDAFALHKEHPDWLLMGEVGAEKIPNFHFGNSPTEVFQHDLAGKTLIHRSTAGTQGVVGAINAERMLVSSFVIAHATLDTIRAIAPETLSFVITGSNNGDEDQALADYLEHSLEAPQDPTPYLERVINSPNGQYFGTKLFPVADLDAAIAIDRFPFAIEVTKSPYGLTGRLV
ncbi:MAG: 2-phosphosulfolactate phosphatase [Chlamydiia bacterium]|nr:2-phosphosulfolactate phosphatase [Chlamydiia bacterium]